MTFKNHTVHPFDNVIAYDPETENCLFEMEMQFQEKLTD